MHDQNGKEQELEKDQIITETQATNREDFTLGQFSPRPILKQQNIPSNIKLTGNLPKDIVNVMSVKPEHYMISFTGLKRILGNVHQQQ